MKEKLQNYITLYSLWVVTFMLNVVDYEITKKAINIEGFMAEANPLALWLLNFTHDISILLWMKILVYSLILCLIPFCLDGRAFKLMRAGLVFGFIGTVMVVAWGAYVLLRLHGV